MKYKLGSLITYKKGYAFKSKDRVSKQDGIPVIKVKNFSDDGIDQNYDTFMPLSFYQKFSKYLLNDNDILIQTVGSWPQQSSSAVGKVVRYRNLDNRPKLLNQNIVNIASLDQKFLDEDYLYWMLKSNKFGDYISGVAQGSANQASITLNSIFNYWIDLPEINTQKKIASILNLFDNNIFLNNQINANLYEQIKTISNSHFSYFDFSDGHIPSNWHYTSLSDVAEITTGYSYTSRELHSSKTAMATIKNFERTGGFSDKGYKEIIPQKKLKDSKIARKFDILVAHTDLTQNADIIGNAEIILDTSIYSQLIYSMDLVRVRTKATNVSQFLLSLILQGDRLKKHCLGYVNGTTVLHLSKKALKEFYIPLPNDLHELDHISKFAKAAYMNIAINIQENSMLQEAKQTLLRKFF